MSKIVGSITKFSGGIADSEKEGVPDSFFFDRSLDFRADAKQFTILPRTAKDSGSVVIDLPLWGVRIGSSNYFIGDNGNIYKEASGTWTLEHTAASSSGNGLAYFGEDDFMYYGQDTTFGRFGPTGGTPQWYDDFLGSEGGDPTNTQSVDFEASSSQSASVADSAAQSLTGDITLEAYINPESLPTTGNTMSIVGKWDESGATRSYLMDIGTVSDFFGDGSDGALTISSNTTEAPIDSTAAGTAGTTSLTATNASFAAGQKILIHQTRGSNAGTYQLTEIASYTAGTITTVDTLDITFATSGDDAAQVRVLKQHTDVTINSGITYTAKAWDESVGGIIGFYASGTVTVNGTVLATGKGFGGGSGGVSDGDSGGINHVGFRGEGTGGASDRVSTNSDRTNENPNGSGGGAGIQGSATGASGGGGGANGSGGGRAKAGNTHPSAPDGAFGGDASGSADLSTMTFGGGGGGGGLDWPSGRTAGSGGAGGGIIALFGATTTVNAGASVISAGSDGTDGSGQHASGGGGGAGGSIIIKAQTATLGSSLITAAGGAKGDADASSSGENDGGAGSEGRIALAYSGSFTGTTTPTLDSVVDSNLASGDGYSLRLGISSDGTTEEFFTWEITSDIDTTTWHRWSITFDASESEAKFYKDGNLLGTKTGTATAIDDNASAFVIAANENSGGSLANFYDGLMDDVRVWNDVRTATEIFSKNDTVLNGTEAGLINYYKLDGDYTDSAGSNDLTATNSPTFSTDVPFSGVTTRADQDQSGGSTGNTYTLTTAINEGATHRQSFVPTRDPNKSVVVNINAIGTGDWTLTVHDALNREIAAVTVTNGNLATGLFEFTFSSVWRPILTATYHFHLTSTVADGTVKTTTSSDLEDAQFTTHFQFLVSDAYHPMAQMLNFLAIGNERYVAKWSGLTSSTYDPHVITLPAGYRVRALGYWREFLAIGTWRGTAITDEDQGRIFFWDGTSETYNFYIDVPEGGINALFGTKGVLYASAGYSGDILVYQGGDAAQKIKKVPKLTTNKFIEMAPGAMTMWRSLLHFGVGINGDTEEVERGVYTYGSLNHRYPEALGFSYPLSLGSQTSSSVKVGCVFPSGQDLFIGWRNNNSYGMDKVAVSNDPYASATYESLISDLSDLPKNKLPLVVRVDFEALKSGETVTAKYKINRASTFQSGSAEDTVGATSTRLRVPKEANEIQIAVDLATTVSTAPVVTGISLESERAESTIGA